MVLTVLIFRSKTRTAFLKYQFYQSIITMKQRIISILNNFGIEASAITDDAHFIKDLGFDSLDLVDLMMQLEQEFSIAIPDEDYANITSLSALMNYLQEQQSVAA